VANTGSLNKNGDGTKIGLKNTRERLRKIYGERGNFELQEENGWVRARIKIG
jgi:sensor histidine kinase YesM